MNLLQRVLAAHVVASVVIGLAAGSASATTIHSGSATGPLYTGPLDLALTAGTTSDAVAGFTSFSCDTSTMSGTLANSDGTGLSISSAAWSDSSDPAGAACPNSLGTSTTFTPQSLDWTGGNLTYVSGGAQALLANVRIRWSNSGIFYAGTCNYKGTGTNTGSVTGSYDNGTGELTFNSVGLALDASQTNPYWCSSTGTWTATYDVGGSGGVRLYVTS
jgi:hypothetical protein